MGCLNSRYRREWDRGGMAGLTLTSLIQLLIQYWKKREIEKRDKARQGRTRQPMESRGKSDVASGVVWGHTSTSTYHAPTHPPTNTHRGIKKKARLRHPPPCTVRVASTLGSRLGQCNVRQGWAASGLDSSWLAG